MAQDGGAQLGRALVQINLRLNRITELLEASRPDAAGTVSPHLDVALDLLDAIDQTLDASRPIAAPWWRRVFAPPAMDLAGLALARDAALAQLQAAGIAPAPGEGPVDPTLHRVIEVQPAPDPDRVGHIARTHRGGWVTTTTPPTAVRLAEVTAWRAPGAP